MKEVLLKGHWVYVSVFLVVALIMAVYEAMKELIFNGALTPWQSHTMTILVTAFLATFAAVIIRSWSENILKKEQILKLQQQKINTSNLILRAVHHIVNNFLHQFQLIRLDVKRNGTVNEETMEFLDLNIKTVAEQLRMLEELQEPDEEKSHEEVSPKQTAS